MPEVTLGDVAYQVPKLNIGQIEDLQSLDAEPKRWTFAALAIVMRRAAPAIPDIREVEADPAQIRVAVETVMAASGYRTSSPNAAAPDQPGQADQPKREAGVI